jgi:glycosyltransferase involved in cell wall biosynthesis
VKKLLYFHNGRSSFVDKDISILNSEYNVIEFCFNVTNKKKVPLFFLKQFVFLLKHFFISKMVVQFGGYHSVLPVFFSVLFKNKKSIIVLGGTDCVSFPSIRYGNFYKKGLRIATSFSLKFASLLLPVDETLIKYKYDYQPNDFPYQGYQYFVKKIQTQSKVIYNGYDSVKWENKKEKESNSFVTVGANLGSRFGFQLKGIDLIFDIAPLFPNCKFYIVGGDAIKDRIIPKNIILQPFIPNNQLVDFISTKQFYLQLSISEGFPNALCEAMLCECIPIVSAVGAMPMIVGEHGYVLEHKSISNLEKIINQALVNNHNLAEIRNRIKNNYTFEKRRNEFLDSIDFN